MAQQQLVRDIMTTPVVGLAENASLVEAARHMRSSDIGDVLVVEGDEVRGIVTDRDIVIRALADNRDPATTTVGEIASRDPVVVAPDQPAADAVELMRTRALRRLPVCEVGRLVGVISLGNLATARDPESALADISAAPPDR
jgi:signal-transduction protein with cAMP-binding, CBS, and nucleotidyltransferase domain